MQRVNMAKRLGLAELTDATPSLERVFEADCPPRNTPIHVPIACRRVNITDDLFHGSKILKSNSRGAFEDAAMAVVNSKVYAVVKSPHLSKMRRSPSAEEIVAAHRLSGLLLKNRIASYCLPEHTLVTGADIARDENGTVEGGWVTELLQANTEVANSGQIDKV